MITNTGRKVPSSAFHRFVCFSMALIDKSVSLSGLVSPSPKASSPGGWLSQCTTQTKRGLHAHARTKKVANHRNRGFPARSTDRSMATLMKGIFAAKRIRKLPKEGKLRGRDEQTGRRKVARKFDQHIVPHAVNGLRGYSIACC